MDKSTFEREIVSCDSISPLLTQSLAQLHKQVFSSLITSKPPYGKETCNGRMNLSFICFRYLFLTQYWMDIRQSSRGSLDCCFYFWSASFPILV